MTGYFIIQFERYFEEGISRLAFRETFNEAKELHNEWVLGKTRQDGYATFGKLDENNTFQFNVKGYEELG